MKDITAPEPIMEMINELEGKKAYNTMNANMKSKIVGYSIDGTDKHCPSYFLRADYFKDGNLSKDPQEHWSIPNPHDPYFVSTRLKLENMKELMKTEKKLKLKTSTKFYYDQIKSRFEFLIKLRQINEREVSERVGNDRIQFIKRE